MINQIAEKYQSKVFKKYFAFFAFSNEQFYSSYNNNFKYARLGSGLYAPAIFAQKVIDKLSDINKKAIEKIESTKTKKDIIRYALSNYETQITGDLQDAIDSLQDYNSISEQDIIKEYRAYYQHCIDNDYF